MSTLYEKSEVLDMLERLCATAGSQKHFAELNGISPQYVSDVLAGRRGIGPGILEALLLRKVVRYERAQAEERVSEEPTDEQMEQIRRDAQGNYMSRREAIRYRMLDSDWEVDCLI